MSSTSNNGAESAARVWVVLARAYAAMSEYVERRVAAEGLCLSDFEVLELLLHQDAMPISAIGSKVLLTNASMTSVIDRMVGRGLVVRKSDPKDRRIRMVELTKQGRTLIAELYPRHLQDLEAVVQVFDQEEREQLRTLLKKLGKKARTAISPEEAIDSTDV